MATYILAFPDSLTVGEIRSYVESETAISVERGWRSEAVPGHFVVFQAPRSNALRDALAKVDTSVEGIVELEPDKGGGEFEEEEQQQEEIRSLPVELPSEALEVLRTGIRNDAFRIKNYAPPRWVWCGRCRTAHRRGWHVK